MSRENVVTYYEKLAAGQELQTKAHAAAAAAAEQATVAVARDEGLVFTLDELRAYVAEKVAELGEEDLDKAAGGAAVGPPMCGSVCADRFRPVVYICTAAAPMIRGVTDYPCNRTK
jgi:predicted ribosomally synthesized peptide with nif11-like leader